jgi:hypothetical protein
MVDSTHIIQIVIFLVLPLDIVATVSEAHTVDFLLFTGGFSHPHTNRTIV